MEIGGDFRRTFLGTFVGDLAAIGRGEMSEVVLIVNLWPHPMEKTWYIYIYLKG